MPADTPSKNGHEPGKGLPPVVAPSGGHIVQLFVVPGAIVLGVVVVLLGCSGMSNWFFGYSRSAEECLKNMKEENPDVRWRAANDLAQILKRDPTLAANPKVGLDLAETLNQALTDLRREEESLSLRRRDPQTTDQDKTRVPATLKAQRKYVQFLSACLGTMSVPVGAPLLTEMARKDKGEDDKTSALLRRHAVWVLANLGDNRKKFDALSLEQREFVLTLLDHEASGISTRASWARQTANVLRGKEDFGVVPALAECARADDPSLREMVAFALGFWADTPADRQRAEQALLKLSGPDEQGHGQRVLLGMDD